MASKPLSKQCGIFVGMVGVVLNKTDFSLRPDKTGTNRRWRNIRATNRTRAVGPHQLQKKVQIQQAVCPNGPLRKFLTIIFNSSSIYISVIFRFNYTAVIPRVSHFFKIWCLNSQLQYNNGRRYFRSVAHRR